MALHVEFVHSGERVQHANGYQTDAAVSSEPAFQVIRRNGAVAPFDQTKITGALTKAFPAVEGSGAAASRSVHEIVEQLTGQIVVALTRRADGRAFHIEEIQYQAELALMRGEHHKAARAYVPYREERARQGHGWRFSASRYYPSSPRHR